MPALVLAMLAYMFWAVAYRLRRERLDHARKADRSEAVFSRRHRIRYLLGKSFGPAEDEPEWQPVLVSHLARANARRQAENVRRQAEAAAGEDFAVR